MKGELGNVNIAKKLHMCTNPVHTEVVPDAVLPAFCLALSSFVGVPTEPVVNVAQDHGMVRGIEKSSIDKLGVRLLLVDGIVIFVHI